MPTPCDNCKIRKGCDWLSELCRLKDAEVARFRPDLIKSERFTDTAKAHRITVRARKRMRRKRREEKLKADIMAILRMLAAARA